MVDVDKAVIAKLDKGKNHFETRNAVAYWPQNQKLEFLK